jgi:hypothetical protein
VRAALVVSIASRPHADSRRLGGALPDASAASADSNRTDERAGQCADERTKCACRHAHGTAALVRAALVVPAGRRHHDAATVDADGHDTATADARRHHATSAGHVFCPTSSMTRE